MELQYSCSRKDKKRKSRNISSIFISNTEPICPGNEMGNRCCSREEGDVDRPLLYQKLEGETKEKREDQDGMEEAKSLTEAKNNEMEDAAVTEATNIEE